MSHLARIEQARYQRQILLEPVGLKGQERLTRARVLVVGAGGLGTPAAAYLLAAGVGAVHVIDGDTVHVSNLHRQVLFSENDCGQNKALVLAAKLRLHNPHVPASAVAGWPRFLDRAAALDLFPEYDLIVDGTDNFAAKYLINDAAVFARKPVIYGAISQFEGRVSVLGGDGERRGPCYRCLYPEPPRATIQNCAEAGVLGPLPGIIGCMQAMEALKCLLRDGPDRGPTIPLEPLRGRIQILDFAFNQMTSLPVMQRAGCLCSRDDLVAEDVIEEPGVVGCRRSRFGAPARLPFEQVIDVREPNEWREFHLRGSLHWPVGLLASGQVPALDVSLDYLTVCQSGGRAQRAAEILRAAGFTRVNAYSGSVYEYSL